jgi:hypothetical protein
MYVTLRSRWSAISEQNQLKIKQLNLVQNRQFQKFGFEMKSRLFKTMGGFKLILKKAIQWIKSKIKICNKLYYGEQIVLNVNVFVLNFKGDLIQMYESIGAPNINHLIIFIYIKESILN